MRVKDLFFEFKGNEIFLLNRIFELYPEEKKNTVGYENFLLHEIPRIVKKQKMPTKASAFCDIMVLIRENKDESGNPFFDVCGVDKKAKKQKDKFLALEFSPWVEWLNWEIHPKSIALFERIDILAHICYEMTFNGFTDKKTKKKAKKMKKIVSELLNGKMKTYSLAEICKEFKSLKLID